MSDDSFSEVQASAPELVSGVVLRSARGLAFIAASDARAIVRLGPIERVEGLVSPALGIAQVKREVVVVIAIDDGGEPVPEGGHAVVCSAGPDRVALVGATVEAVGKFHRDVGGMVRYGGDLAAEIDVRVRYGRVEALAFTHRAARPENTSEAAQGSRRSR